LGDESDEARVVRPVAFRALLCSADGPGSQAAERAEYRRRFDKFKAQGRAKPDMIAISELFKERHGGVPAPLWGHIRGVPPGTGFRDKGDLASCRVHTSITNGIAFFSTANQPPLGREKPATSIVMAGGYGDDDDKGDRVGYTGMGGQTGNVQTSDQKPVAGNRALILNCELKVPVRVCRRRKDHKPGDEVMLTYEGLYTVASYSLRRSKGRPTAADKAAAAAARAEAAAARAAAAEAGGEPVAAEEPEASEEALVENGPQVYIFDLVRIPELSSEPAAPSSSASTGSAPSTERSPSATPPSTPRATACAGSQPPPPPRWRAWRRSRARRRCGGGRCCCDPAS